MSLSGFVAVVYLFAIYLVAGLSDTQPDPWAGFCVGLGGEGL